MSDFGTKLAHFHDLLDLKVKTVSPAYLDGLIEKYIDRDLEELKEIRSTPKPWSDKQKTMENEIDYARKKEREDYHSSGFEFIDLLDEDTFLNFATWDKMIKNIPSMKRKKFIKSELLDQK